MRTEYLVKIGDLYLTDDASENDTRYISNIDNLAALQRNADEVKRSSFRKQVYFEVTYNENYADITFTIRLLGCKFGLLEDLCELMRQQKATLPVVPVPVILTNPYNSNFSHSLNCNIDAVTWGAMMSNQFRDVAIQLTTTGVYT